MTRSILNPQFVYRNSAETDLRKTFAKVRREMRQAEQKAVEQPAQSAVVRLAAKGKK